MNTASVANTTSGTQTTTDGASTVTTVLPIPPVNVEIVPNPDLTDLNIKQSLVGKKIHDINELYNKELFDNAITEADLHYIVKSFTVADLNSENINNMILTIISCYNG
jgi:hypothetical protein